jgi:hypothetical protein
MNIGLFLKVDTREQLPNLPIQAQSMPEGVGSSNCCSTYVGKLSTTLCWPNYPGAREFKSSLPLVLVVHGEVWAFSFPLSLAHNLNIPTSFQHVNKIC